MEKDKQVSEPVAMSFQQISQNERLLDDKQFEIQNGILLYAKVPYSGLVKEYYPNNKLRSECVYYLGKRNGHYYGWYENGNKRFERFYSNGTKTRTHVGWFEDAQQMFFYNFDNKGAYHGAVLDWYANGVLANHFNYSHGKEEGSQKTWDSDAKLKANFHTVNGERYGLIGLKSCGGSTKILNKQP